MKKRIIFCIAILIITIVGNPFLQSRPRWRGRRGARRTAFVAPFLIGTTFLTAAALASAKDRGDGDKVTWKDLKEFDKSVIEKFKEFKERIEALEKRVAALEYEE